MISKKSMTQKIDSSNLDVIVIGAGPAGGSCARELSKLGKKVLIIERSQEIGEPNYSTAGTPKETIEMFDLPKKVISASWDRLFFATPRVAAEFKYPEIMGYVFDFAELRRFLAEDAAGNGAEIMVGTSATDFIIEREHIVGVKYHGVFGDGEARAKVIVDATGHHEFGNSRLRINPLSNEAFGSGTEYLMTGMPSDFHNTLSFFLGPDYAPGGYAWIFPMNKNSLAKVGVCAMASEITGTTIQNLQERFIESQPYFRNMEPIEIHAGAARADGGVLNHVYKNVVLVGDSARQINPLLGEGVRHCLMAGRLAAKVISDSLTRGKCDEAFLKKTYGKIWHENFGTKWRLSLISSKALAKLSANEMDEFITLLQSMSPEDCLEMFSHYDYKRLLKYPKMLTSAVARTVFRGIF